LNSASMTGPMIWTMVPVLLMSFFVGVI